MEDMSKAFDTVNHGKLLDLIAESIISPHPKCWIANYFHGRQTFVNFEARCSSRRISLTSALHAVPEKHPGTLSDIELIPYADDCTILKLNNYLQIQW